MIFNSSNRRARSSSQGPAPGRGGTDCHAAAGPAASPNRRRAEGLHPAHSRGGGRKAQQQRARAAVRAAGSAMATATARIAVPTAIVFPSPACLSIDAVTLSAAGLSAIGVFVVPFPGPRDIITAIVAIAVTASGSTVTLSAAHPISPACANPACAALVLRWHSRKLCSDRHR